MPCIRFGLKNRGGTFTLIKFIPKARLLGLVFGGSFVQL
jgi:hypothetical protein